VIRFFHDWVEHRTGVKKVVDVMLLEGIPGGAKWRYVWGSALAIVFSIQMITGVLLMTAYSPGDSTAWGSVYFIQYEMDFGWLIRGLHHFGSQTMVVLLGIHMLQVVIAGAHLKPREVNWWLGLGLAGVVLGLSLTGYLLPWDQKGFYATQVATNIAGGIKYVGPFIQKVAVGGSEYGNHTLTRFFGLHVAILPGILIALLIAHIWVFRRHGITHPKNPVGHGWFWPDQAFRDMVVGLIMFAIMLGLVFYGWGNKIEPTPGPDGTVAARSTYDKIAHAGRDGRGANLDAPADKNTDYPARPEWYFLFLFQLLKYFPGDQSYIGTLVIPGAIATILFILPFLGVGKLRPVGHFFAVIFVIALLSGAAYLTAQAWVEDQKHETIDKQPYKLLKDVVASKRYNPALGDAHQKHMEEADRRAQRAVQLGGAGSPAAGSLLLLRNDPMTTGKDLFKQHCATCHNHYDEHAEHEAMNVKPIASDLTNWGTKEWIKGLLADPNSDHYFGKSHLKDGKMAKWVTGAAGKKASKDFDDIADWLGSHPRKEPGSDDPLAKGFNKFSDACKECHTFKDPIADGADAPDLTGYGDDQWLREMIMAPAHPSKYNANNRMPGFRDKENAAASILEEAFANRKQAAIAAADNPQKKAAADAAHKMIALSDLERELIIRFVLKDDRVVFGGEPISGPPK
jgi:quinol-cytochrome oxidoreductase complex cytochrome b subunit/mono/diheme cytochrome c family protein